MLDINLWANITQMSAGRDDEQTDSRCAANSNSTLWRVCVQFWTRRWNWKTQKKKHNTGESQAAAQRSLVSLKSV